MKMRPFAAFRITIASQCCVNISVKVNLLCQLNLTLALSEKSDMIDLLISSEVSRSGVPTQGNDRRFINRN